MPDSTVTPLIPAAGDLERFRPYLRLLARDQVHKCHQAKLDASDIVQQTLLEAHRSLPQFRGGTEAELAGWLRQILAFSLADAIRALTRAKRDPARERAMQNDLNASSARLESMLIADQTSPSLKVEKREQVIHMAGALTQLPEPQQEAVLLRHYHGLSMEQIAERMGRTEKSISGLLRRGMSQLRSLMNGPPEED